MTSRSDLERLSKAEIVARFGGVDDETLALSQVVQAVEPLAHKRWRGGEFVLDQDAQVRVLRQALVRLGLNPYDLTEE